MSTQAASQALYQQLDSQLPNWRTTYSSVREAVAAAGERARELFIEWKVAFEVRSQQMPTLKRVDEGAPFGHSAIGSRVSAERRDEAGAEDFNITRKEERNDTDKIAVGQPKANYQITASGEYLSSGTTEAAFKEDSLSHPGRPMTGRYSWPHRAPREDSCIHCY